MSIESAIALAIATFILAATPGPAVFAIVARALALGFRSTMTFIFGVIAGDMVYLVMAAYGLSVLATQYAAAFGVLKILGGVYLIYLGIQTWRSAKYVETGVLPVPEKRGGRTFLSGLALTLGNPKAVVFYVAFLPAFMDLEALSLTGLAVASVVVSVTLFAVLAGFALMAARAREMFRTPRAVRNLHRGAGGLMVGAGGAVAAS